MGREKSITENTSITSANHCFRRDKIKKFNVGREYEEYSLKENGLCVCAWVEKDKWCTACNNSGLSDYVEAIKTLQKI